MLVVDVSRVQSLYGYIDEVIIGVMARNNTSNTTLQLLLS